MGNVDKGNIWGRLGVLLVVGETTSEIDAQLWSGLIVNSAAWRRS